MALADRTLLQSEPRVAPWFWTFKNCSWRVPQHGPAWTWDFPGIFRVFDAMRSPSEQWLPLFHQLDDHPQDVTFEDSQRVSPGTLPCSFPAAREDGDLWLENVAYLGIFYIT